MKCTHTLGEQDTVVADGACPLCLEEKLETTRVQLSQTEAKLQKIGRILSRKSMTSLLRVDAIREVIEAKA